MVLDQRTDLYALGAVAYWALTRRHAYEVRRLEDLVAAWEKLPIPPSDLVSDIPHALEALYFSHLKRCETKKKQSGLSFSSEPLSSSSVTVTSAAAAAANPPRELAEQECRAMQSSD